MRQPTALHACTAVLATRRFTGDQRAAILAGVIRWTQTDVIQIGHIDASAAEPARIRCTLRRGVAESLARVTANTLRREPERERCARRNEP